MFRAVPLIALGYEIQLVATTGCATVVQIIHSLIQGTRCVIWKQRQRASYEVKRTELCRASRWLTTCAAEAHPSCCSLTFPSHKPHWCIKGRWLNIWFTIIHIYKTVTKEWFFFLKTLFTGSGITSQTFVRRLKITISLRKEVLAHFMVYFHTDMFNNKK